jgi:hypothetical protein
LIYQKHEPKVRRQPQASSRDTRKKWKTKAFAALIKRVKLKRRLANGATSNEFED